MRELINKYQGECQKCRAILEVGSTVMYEKSMGVFCLGCEPKGVEEIRHYRTLKAEAKAERYEEWADKREQKATADLNSFPTMRHDWAFITQPGHIPARARMIKADDRALESLGIAKGMRNKAENIRNIRVAGDAARRDQAKREANDLLIHKGSRVFDVVFGTGEVVGVFSKSYRIKWDRSERIWSRDKIFVDPIKEKSEVSQCGQ